MLYTQDGRQIDEQQVDVPAFMGATEMVTSLGPAGSDTTPPTTTATPSARGWTKGDVTVTLEATDTGGSGLQPTYWQIDSGAVETYAADNQPLLTSSAQTLTYWSTDNAGNKEPDNTLGAQIDKIAPTTTATPSASGWTKGDVTVTLDATDTGGSGLQATYWQIDNGAVETYAADNQPLLTSSAQTLTYWSTDNAGNTEPATP